MLRSRSTSAKHIHYASGIWGTTKWMAYWTASRLGNVGRASRLHWRSQLRPALADRSDAVKGRVDGALRRSPTSTHAHAYDSLADAVQQRRLTNARG